MLENSLIFLYSVAEEILKNCVINGLKYTWSETGNVKLCAIKKEELIFKLKTVI